MMPKQSAMEIPLLRCLHEMGGKGRPVDVYKRIQEFFPDLTEADLAETLSSGGSKWTNRIQWVRQRLVERSELTNAERGVWSITDKGRQRLAKASKPSKEEGYDPVAAANMMRWPSAELNLEEVADDYLNSFKQKMAQRLIDLSPAQFERFAAALVKAYGFTNVQITGRAGDGGIDGHGKLTVGLAPLNVAFQCKRWQGPVGRPEIDKFRGAIQGKFEQGIFFTTSDFSGPAREASIQKGAVTVVLVNGDGIVQLMIDKGFCIRRRPLEIYEDQINTLFE